MSSLTVNFEGNTFSCGKMATLYFNLLWCAGRLKIVNDPEEILISPNKVDIRVVFPAPLGPINATHWLEAILNDISSKIVFYPMLLNI